MKEKKSKRKKGLIKPVKIKNKYSSDVYDKNYFDTYDVFPYNKNEHWIKFFGEIAKRIKKEINPKTVLDVGCAKGFLVEQLRSKGIKAYGIDISEYAISEVPDHIKPFCKVGSVLKPLDRKYDLITCIEVIEHLYPEDAKKAISNLTKHSHDIIFSASPIHSKEKTHHNVKEPSYWTKLFSEVGFYRDEKFDPSFITHWAARYKKGPFSKSSLIRSYEKALWLANQERLDLKTKLGQFENDLASYKKKRTEIEQKNIHKIKSQFETSPLGTLLSLYADREDLQNSFPEVRDGDYSKIIDWASQVVSKTIGDSSFDALKNKSEWYLHELKKSEKLEILPKMLEQKERDITELEKIREQNTQKIEELESARQDSTRKIEELKLTNIESSKKINLLEQGNQKLRNSEDLIKNELQILKDSAPYIIAKDITSYLDEKLPPNSKLGKLLRKIVYKKYKKILSEHAKVIESQFSYDYQFDDTLNKKSIDVVIDSLDYKPKISILMPVYNSNISFLKKAIQSVKDQYYTNWQLCICDDGSTNEEIHKILKEESSADERISMILSKKNEGISSASNKALNLAEGEFTLLLDHDDELSKNALLEITKTINENPSVEFIYSDEDKIDENDPHVTPFFKPNWSPDLLFSYNYPIHVSVFQTPLLKKLEGFRKGFEGAQDYDLNLRYLEHAQKIVHIPQVLYSWRKNPGSAASSPFEKEYAYDAGKRALNDALKRRKIDAECIGGIQMSTYRVKYRIRENPLISIIIPTKTLRNIQKCIESILQKSTYRNFEIIVMDSSKGDTIKKFCHEFKKIRHEKLIQEKFNFSKINNKGVKRSQGEYIVFLNDDTEVISPDWIEGLLEHAQRKEVGIVGSKLLYKDDHVQHAGTIVGMQGYAGNYGGIHKSDPGYFFYAKIIRNCSAVTAACMMMKKNTFTKVGGFDEQLANSWQDVDLCISVINSGKLILYTPYSVLYHYEGGTRGSQDVSEEELEAKKKFREKNKDFISKGDPYYNPNLSLYIPYQVVKNYKKPLKDLVDMYERRSDLQQAFPNEQENNFKNLIDWVVTQGIVIDSEKQILQPHSDYYFENCSENAKPLAEEIRQFLKNKELQGKFPEVFDGKFDNLIEYLEKNSIKKNDELENRI